MKILTFSTLYPNAVNPAHGIFVETRLRHLLASGRAQSTVVAPVPWFPFADRRFGKYAGYARVPREECRHEIKVLHPRYPMLPKIGMTLAPLLLAAAVKPVLERALSSGAEFDLIDAHYFYPDGVAAALLGRKLDKPVVITARGSDVNLLPQYELPRRMILWAARRAAELVTVSTALKTALTQLGVDSGKITVLRNGVDTRLFCPADRSSQRVRLGLTGTVLLMVGNLVPLKGHELVLRSLPALPDTCLLIVGAGSEERNLRLLTVTLQIQDRVRFLGALPQAQLPAYHSAADALVLASSREGWPNVLLEAMACGTPVVASRVGGTSEIVDAPEAGVLMAERSVTGLVEALNRLFANYPDRKRTRRYAEKFSWDDTTRGQLDLFDRILGQQRCA